MSARKVNDESLPLRSVRETLEHTKQAKVQLMESLSLVLSWSDAKMHED